MSYFAISFNGKAISVLAVLKDQSEVDNLITALRAIAPMLP